MAKRSRTSNAIHTVQPDTSGGVTVCITQEVKQDKQAAFEAWLRDTSEVAQSFPGHQGISIIHKAGSRKYTYIFRFDSYDHLRVWETSPEKKRRVAQLKQLIATDARKQILTGLEYWFTLPNDTAPPSPPRYKMCAITILAIYPLTTLLGYIANPAPLTLVHLLKGLFISVTAVVAMTYVIMPRLTRLFAGWLFKKS